MLVHTYNTANPLLCDEISRVTFTGRVRDILRVVGLFVLITEHDQLLILAYERINLKNELDIEPHLWSYHSRITIEHLAQTLQEKEMRKSHPILYGFLQAVSPSVTVS